MSCLFSADPVVNSHLDVDEEVAWQRNDHLTIKGTIFFD